VIDKVPNDVATSVNGARWGGLEIQAGVITGRAVQLIVPKGSMTGAQRVVLDWVRQIAKQNSRPVDIIVTEF
jgi:hypothetical protein